jgi:hypothetical protein
MYELDEKKKKRRVYMMKGKILSSFRMLPKQTGSGEDLTGLSWYFSL